MATNYVSKISDGTNTYPIKDTEARDAIAALPSVGDATITITQGGVTKGTFTTNQSSDATIVLDSGGGGGSADVDGITIETNSSDKLQVIGTINKNTETGATNPIYDWVGTLAEYQTQQIKTLHPDWLCYITDDLDASEGASNIDNSTITMNVDDKIQAVATVNANNAAGATNPIYDWVGTLQEYIDNNIATTHPEYVCYITDDNDGGDSVYTKDEVDIIAGSKANLNLDNSNVITNCITHIPQDIKLELNNGTLTLKAGSKVYVPNGVGVFDVFNVSSDYVSSSTGANQTMVCCYIQDVDSIGFRPLSNCTSGANATATMGYAYDTTTNKIRFFNSSSVIQHNICSFPIAIVKTDNNGLVASIDQVFNGFGYIGSTVFALPGVKCLIPNGRNGDGTLKNTEYSISNVLTRTFTTIGGMGAGYAYSIALLNNGFFDREYYYTLTQDNYLLGSDGVIYQGFEVFKVAFDSNIKITSFTSKTAFHAVDYNDTEFIANQAMPSEKRLALTPANEGTYTAPADGYFTLFATANTSNGFAGFRRNGLVVSMFSSLVNTTSGAFEIPVRKGETISLFYGNISTPMLYFEYAQGTTNE